MKNIISSFRPTEKFFFGICVVIALLTGLYIIDIQNKAFSVERPISGGSYTEGVVGYARFINPVLAYSDADKDMISLVYSGLLKPSEDGKLIADLADSWSVSEDGLTYSVILKPNLVFHDGAPLTTDDVAFTIEKMRDPNIKSPKADVWIGVKVEVVNSTEIHFILKNAYAPFLENLTFGILPKHLWNEVEYQGFDVHILNREPIGSGPYKIKKAFHDDSGIYQYYNLEPFAKYALGKPYIEHFTMQFFKNEETALYAYTSGSIQALGGISPESANLLREQGYNVTSASLPRIFGVFLNQSSAPVLTNKEVRTALTLSVDRNAIIQDVLKGWGSPESGPIPENLNNQPVLGASDSSGTNISGTSTATSSDLILTAQKTLTDKGWKLGTDNIFVKETKSGKNTSTQKLSFTISTSNVPELKRTAEILKDTWTKLGADVTVQIFEPSDLTQKVIRPRKYDALLFGNVIGRDLDLFPFWHSSERNDPGLNIALYTNIKADKALEAIRAAVDESARIDAFKAFSTEVENDIPAIFLYSPGYIYAIESGVHGVSLENMTSTSERFMNIENWYMDTERVWKIFVQDK